MNARREEKIENHIEMAERKLGDNWYFDGTRPETKYAMQQATVAALIAIATALQDIAAKMEERHGS